MKSTAINVCTVFSCGVAILDGEMWGAEGLIRTYTSHVRTTTSNMALKLLKRSRKWPLKGAMSITQPRHF